MPVGGEFLTRYSHGTRYKVGRASKFGFKDLLPLFNLQPQLTKGINSDHRQKLGDQLDFLTAATIVDYMDIPGYRLHPLKGNDKGRWSITVSGNWRLTFEFFDGDVYLPNYEDYQ